MSIPKLHNSYLNRTVSPEIVKKLIFQDIKDRNPSLNAFITLLNDISNEAAKQSSDRYQQNQQKSCLDGIPIVVKDNFCLENQLTTCGSKMLMNFKPLYTATAVKKLMNHGSVIIGKTNMDEFAMGSSSKDSAYGEIKNPWKDNDGEICVTGGSSGGTAVSVAAGWALAGLGTDTGGSIRLPAALTGLVGFKPSYGLISRHGVISLMNALDTVSIISRTVEDAKIVFDALIGKDPQDLTSRNFDKQKSKENPDSNVIRVGIPKEMHPAGLDPEILDYWEQAADFLSSRQSQYSVRKVELPHIKHAGKCYSVLCCAEVASNMSRYDGVRFGGVSVDTESKKMSFDEFVAETRSKGFGTSVRERILMGNFFLLKKNRAEYMDQAQRVWRLICRDFDTVFGTGLSLSANQASKADVLLTPVCLEPAPPIRHFTSHDNRITMVRGDICTQPASLAGIPAITVPVGLSPSRGVPIGLQVVGPTGRDDLVLEVARDLEAWAQFSHRFPFVYETAVKEAESSTRPP